MSTEMCIANNIVLLLYRYYQSFNGKDFKALAQCAPFVLWNHLPSVHQKLWFSLELVRYHMTQSLVVDHTHKNVCFEFSTIYPVVESLIAIVVITSWGITEVIVVRSSSSFSLGV